MQTNIDFDLIFCIELSGSTTRKVSMHAMFLEFLPRTAVLERARQHQRCEAEGF